MNKHQKASDWMRMLKNAKQQLASKKAYLQKQMYQAHNKNNLGNHMWLLGKEEAYREAIDIVNRQIRLMKLIQMMKEAKK